MLYSLHLACFKTQDNTSRYIISAFLFNKFYISISTLCQKNIHCYLWCIFSWSPLSNGVMGADGFKIWKQSYSLSPELSVFIKLILLKKVLIMNDVDWYRFLHRLDTRFLFFSHASLEATNQLSSTSLPLVNSSEWFFLPF